MPSFDVVCEPDIQEIRNAVDQTKREVVTRYDLKDAGAEIEHIEDAKAGEGIRITARDEHAVEAVTDVLIGKLVKRSVDPRFFEKEDVEAAGGGRARRMMKLRKGITQELAKDVVRQIKDAKMKVQPQIRGDELRITGKSKDELQDAIRFIKGLDLDRPLSFSNFRD
jgi:uncharacterized protein YajQ (UPF0234 family)